MTSISTPELKTFTFVPGLDLRCIEREGEAWFIGSDACRVLGYSNASMAMARHVAAKHKATVAVGLRGKAPILITESGLYALVFGSQQKCAKEFQAWVTDDVLPSLRKHGMAMTAQAAREAIESPEQLLARALVVANETIAKLSVQAEGLALFTLRVWGDGDRQARPHEPTRDLGRSRRPPIGRVLQQSG